MSDTTDSVLEARRVRSEQISGLLAKHFPKHRTRNNIFDVPGFAQDCGYTHETIYKAIRQKEELKRPVAQRIVEKSRELPGAIPLGYSNLLMFMFHDWGKHGLPGVSDLQDEEADDLLA